jgi:hypothetical protein
MTLTTIVTVMLEGAKEAENEAGAPKQPTGTCGIFEAD